MGKNKEKMKKTIVIKQQQRIEKAKEKGET